MGEWGHAAPAWRFMGPASRGSVTGHGLVLTDVDAMTNTNAPQRNIWINLGVNVLLPALILMKGNEYLAGLWPEAATRPTAVLCVALAFPLGMGLYDWVISRTWNVFSILGAVSVLLTGGIGLLKLPPAWVAIKEALIPFILALAVFASDWLGKPLVKVLLLRPELLNTDVIEARIAQLSAQRRLDAIVRLSNGLFGVSFLLSTVLNYTLAVWIVRSPAGTEAFNEEIARMMLLSYPVIVLPSMVVSMAALYVFFNRVTKLTGLTLKQILH